MIVCRKCSRRHADGTTFCTCGAFLEFDGERVADLAPPTEAATGADTSSATPSTSAGPPPESWAASPPDQERPPASEPAPWSGLPSDTPPATTGGVEARLPDAPLNVSDTEPVWVESGGRPTDLACRQCGTPNPPEREFCRHCGQSLRLATATTSGSPGQKRLPWWRRLSKRARREARTVDPMSLSVSARQLSRGGLAGRPLAFRTAGITVLLLGLLAFLGPWRGTVIAKAKDLVGASRYQVLDDEVAVRSAPASPSITPLDYELQPAELVLDTFENTAWASRWVEPDRLGVSALPADETCTNEVGTDSVLQFTFDEPTDVSRIRILGGRFAGDEARKSFSRPHIVELRTGDSCAHLELADDGQLEIHDFRHDDVTEVELRIIGRYAEEESAPTVEVSAVVFERKG